MMDAEITRLLDLMPASGRMMTRLVSKPQQPSVIAAMFPLPWQEIRPITINFELWQQLPQAERDLLLLHTVCWLINIEWFKPDLYQGLTAAGLAVTAIELLRTDAVGIVVTGGLTTLAAMQIWRQNRSVDSVLEADKVAVQVAQRRGYSKQEATEALINAIATVAKLEGRSGLTVTELLRTQKLRSE